MQRSPGLPGSGIEPVSPALAGRFFTAEPPARLVHREAYRLYSIHSYYKVGALLSGLYDASL